MTAFTVTTRKAAHAAGLKRYYTGRPCAHGHDAERFVTTGSCVQCNREASGAFRREQRQSYVARLRGQFAYMLHPDDHAAALAFCQALDMQRGLAPSMPAAPAVRTPPTREQLEQARREIFGLAADMVRPQVDPLAHGWK